MLLAHGQADAFLLIYPTPYAVVSMSICLIVDAVQCVILVLPKNRTILLPSAHDFPPNCEDV